jgi:hypothetical protein
VAREDLVDMDVVLAKILPELADRRRFIAIVELSDHQLSQLFAELTPSHIGVDGEELEQPSKPPDQGDVADEDKAGVGMLNPYGDPDLLTAKMSYVDLGHSRCDNGSLFEEVEITLEGSTELLLHDPLRRGEWHRAALIPQLGELRAELG